MALIASACVQDQPTATPEPSGASSADPMAADTDRLAIDDLQYRGGFRFAEAVGGDSRLAHGLAALGLGPDGDTLFITGRRGDAAVAEYPIVAPEPADTVADLPVTPEHVQPFTSLLEGVPTGNPQALDRIGGMAVVDGALVANAYEYYDAPADNSHTTVSLSDATRLNQGSVTGFAEMGGAAHSAGWISPIPEQWQSALGGTHISGQSSGIPINGRSSIGPSAFAVNLDASLSTVGQAHPLIDFSLDAPMVEDFHNESGTNDMWTSLSRAVYGVVVPGTSTYLTLGTSGGATAGVSYGVPPYGGSKGYYPNDRLDVLPYYWLFDVEDMVAVRNGELSPSDVVPYAYGPMEVPFADFAGDRLAEVGGATFDPESGRLYVSLTQTDFTASEFRAAPIVVAFDIATAGPSAPVADSPLNPDPSEPVVPEPVSPEPTSVEPEPADPEPTASGASPHCPAYVESPLHRERSNQIVVGPDDDWEATIANAASDTEVLLADGTYWMTRYAVYMANPDITVRSASGDREAVVIIGQGYGEGGEGLMVAAPNITIADLSMTDIRNHAISLKPEEGAAATHVYNTHLYDIGTQHIKGSGGGENPDGVVACSSIGYTPGGAVGDYIGGIDVHQGVDWVVRDNYLYNITGDGTGCEIDIDCGTYTTDPAIYFWQDSRGTVIERNVIIDSFRGITLGLGQGHQGGVVRNNFIHRAQPGDAGIELWDAPGAVVEHNTVIVAGYPGAIEYGGSPAVTLRNNLLSAPPLDRSASRGASDGIVIEGNITDATASDLMDPSGPHVRETSRVVGAGVAAETGDDFDGDARVGRWDVGADQVTGSAVAPATPVTDGLPLDGLDSDGSDEDAVGCG